MTSATRFKMMLSGNSVWVYYEGNKVRNVRLTGDNMEIGKNLDTAQTNRVNSALARHLAKAAA